MLSLGVRLFDASAEDSFVIQLGLLDVPDVVILHRKVVVAAHLRVFIVELPRQRELVLEVVDSSLVVPDRTIGHADLLRHPHLLLKQAPRATIVPQGLIRLDSLVVVTELDHYVTFRLEQAVEDELVLEQRILIVSELTNEGLEHPLQRLKHLLDDDLFDAFQLLVHIVDIGDGCEAFLAFLVGYDAVVAVVSEHVGP